MELAELLRSKNGGGLLKVLLRTQPRPASSSPSHSSISLIALLSLPPLQPACLQALRRQRAAQPAEHPLICQLETRPSPISSATVLVLQLRSDLTVSGSFTISAMLSALQPRQDQFLIRFPSLILLILNLLKWDLVLVVVPKTLGVVPSQRM